jgi:hypothetical protein
MGSARSPIFAEKPPPSPETATAFLNLGSTRAYGSESEPHLPTFYDGAAAQVSTLLKHCLFKAGKNLKKTLANAGKSAR